MGRQGHSDAASPMMAFRSLLLIFAITPSIVFAEAAPRWSVVCEKAPRDQFGDGKRQYCSLLLYNQNKASGFGLLMDDGLTYVLNGRTILEIDKSGIRLGKPKRGGYCSASNLRIAVDGKRIDGLSSAQQIQAMTTGKTFVWEEQADWPHCQNKAPHGTMLDGFNQALQELKEKFGAIER